MPPGCRAHLLIFSPSAAALFKVPFTCQDKLAERGAKYKEGAAWSETVAVDGNLITGQNPPSAKAVADAVVKALA